MYRLIFSVFCVGIICLSCKGVKDDSNVPSEIISMMDMAHYDVDEIPPEYIKNFKYINFDNTNSDFLFKGIDKIYIYEDLIYVLDRRLKKMLVFNMEGEPIAEVGKRGQGPGEYIQITDFDIDTKGNIYVVDGVLDKLIIYDSLFQLVKEQKLEFEIDVIQCLPDGNLLLGVSSWNSGSYAGDKVISVDPFLSKIETFLTYDKYIDDLFWISEYIFVVSGEYVYYNRPIDNNVYLFSLSGNVGKVYNIDWGRHNVPDKDKINVETNLYKYDKYTCLKNFTIITDEYIIGTLWESKQTKMFFADRKMKEIYKLPPVADIDVSDFVGCFNNHIISYIYPGKYDMNAISKLPPSVANHVNNEGISLCLREIY